MREPIFITASRAFAASTVGQKRPLNDILWLLRLIAWLWLGYLVILMIIDNLFVIAVQTSETIPMLYYIGNAVTALGILMLASWRWTETRSRTVVLNCVIIAMALFPRLITIAMTPYLPHSAISSAEQMDLRILPVSLSALVLIAWQHRWLYVVIFSFGTAMLGFFPYLVGATAYAPPIIPSTLATVIETISFLIIGAVIRALMARIRQQQSDLSAAHLRLRTYANTIETLAITRERNRVARELHDTLAHTLSGMTVQLEAVKAYWDIDAGTSFRMVDESLQTARSGLVETRRALTALRAHPLEDLGLILAIKELATATMARANVQLVFIAPTMLQDSVPVHSLLSLSPDVESSMYRIMQEALSNIVLHAQAKTVTITIAVRDNHCTGTIEDDGQGFDVQQPVPDHHYGIAGMQERTHLIGGQLSITSTPGHGTILQLDILFAENGWAYETINL